MGGRGSSSGMGKSGGGNLSNNDVFGGKSLSQVTENFLDDYSIHGKKSNEKYRQVQEMADGVHIDYYASEVVRTQAMKTAPAEFVGTDYRGNRINWGNPSSGQGVNNLMKSMSSSAISQLESTLQSSAQKWLNKNPKNRR